MMLHREGVVTGEIARLTCNCAFSAWVAPSRLAGSTVPVPVGEHEVRDARRINNACRELSAEAAGKVDAELARKAAYGLPWPRLSRLLAAAITNAEPKPPAGSPDPKTSSSCSTDTAAAHPTPHPTPTRTGPATARRLRARRPTTSRTPIQGLMPPPDDSFDDGPPPPPDPRRLRTHAPHPTHRTPRQPPLPHHPTPAAARLARAGQRQPTAGGSVNATRSCRISAGCRFSASSPLKEIHVGS